MIIEAVVLGLLFGKLRNGDISKLDKLNFKGIGALAIVLILDTILRFVISRSESMMGRVFFTNYPLFAMALYLFTIFILEINKDLKHLRLIEAGFVLNFLPMVLNGGKMPVLESAMVKLGKLKEIELLRENLLFSHQLIDESTRLYFLGDILPLPTFLPKVISIGDIVMALGLILFIGHYMTRGRENEQ